jgi:hypothetical protein
MSWLPRAGPSDRSFPACEPTTNEVQALAKEARDRGFLWKIQKDGHTGYLYGSIHLGK